MNEPTFIKFDDNADLFASLIVAFIRAGLVFRTTVEGFGVDRVHYTITLTGGF